MGIPPKTFTARDVRECDRFWPRVQMPRQRPLGRPVPHFWGCLTEAQISLEVDGKC